MSKELTYILGAGASYQSIPVVKSFSNRFSTFLLFLHNFYSESNDFNNGRGRIQYLKDYHEIGEALYRDFLNHQSFDTYFKKLFHTKQEDQIQLAKKFLHLYFIWEHSLQMESKPQLFNETIFWKQSQIDRRYDAMIAGLLKPIMGKSEVFCRTNFISWNYDLNLISSIKNFFSPIETFGEFFKEITIQNNVWKIGDQITIMNGFFYSKHYDSQKIITDNIYKDIFGKKLIGTDYLTSSFIDNDSETIRFAWESENSISELAKETIKKSDEIVVIGYTFPLYNRLIDHDYFNGILLGGKTIYFQDPQSEKLKESIKTDFDIRINMENSTDNNHTSIKAIENCDSFFIPSGIFPLLS